MDIVDFPHTDTVWTRLKAPSRIYEQEITLAC